METDLGNKKKKKKKEKKKKERKKKRWKRNFREIYIYMEDFKQYNNRYNSDTGNTVINHNHVSLIKLIWKINRSAEENPTRLE